MNLQYWTVDSDTREVFPQMQIAAVRGGVAHIPTNALQVEPLPPKAGFVVLANTELSGSEYIADHRGQTLYLKTDCNQSRTVEALGDIEPEWTLTAPNTQFDQWLDEHWQTNTQNQYEAEFNRIDDIRRSRYVMVVDPLLQEANIKRLQGNTAEAEVLETQAMAARAYIQQLHPWPVAPIGQ